MNVERLQELVARKKVVDAKLIELRAELQFHEEAMSAVYERGSEVAAEGQEIGRALHVELGLEPPVEG